MSATQQHQLETALAAGVGEPPRAVTWRSVLIGTLAAVAICGLTPYNDFVLSDNTSLVTGFLPLAAVLIQFLIIVGLNAPLHLLAPRHALRSGELAVILLMVLVACGLPNWGLMRFFIPTPVSPFHLGATDEPFWKAFIGMDLPTWLFPVSSMQEGRSEGVVEWFFNRIPEGKAIPYGAWVVPLLVWGIFIAAMLATLTAVARLVLEQWMTNERLPFPLVQVQTALIDPPAPGRGLNELFRSRLLWIGLVAVLVIHSLNALAAYDPRHFDKMKVPLGFDFTGFISERPTTGEPLSYFDKNLKKATVSFIVIGVTYFIRSKVAFSLWGIYILINGFNALYAMRGGMEMPSQAYQDQHLGAVVAFIAGIFWIGRQHWARILRNAVGRGTDSNYRGAFWIAVAGTLVMVGWLRVMGVHLWLAGFIVLFIVAAHLIVSRVLAETGLPFYRSGIAVSQVYSSGPTSWLTMRDIYFSQVFTVLGPLTTRDSVMGFTMTGLGATKTMGVSEKEKRKLGGVIAWTLIVGFIVAAVSTLHCQYSYPTPMNENDKPPRNYFGAQLIPPRDVAPAMKYFAEKPPRFIPKSHDTKKHFAAGLIITALLEVAALRSTSWPLLPVGYVVSYGAFMGNAWLSIFFGWLAKVVIVRFGGASLFQKARPLFVGIIFGEALAAGMWLIVNAIVVLGGGDMRTVKILL